MADILTLATSYKDEGPDGPVSSPGHPRTDYLELNKSLTIDIFDYSSYDETRFGDLFRRLEIQLRSDPYLAYLGLKARRDYRLVFAMSERAGIPFAWLKKLLAKETRFVSMFQCWSWRQELVIKRLKLLSAMDEIIVHCENMKRILSRLGQSQDQIHVIHYGVDHRFFYPAETNHSGNGIVLSLGEGRTRDYPMLIEAVRDLPVEVVIAAFGHWYSREKRSSAKLPIPDNVTLEKHLRPLALRDLYSRARIVVVPTHPLPYSAGVTVALEAACMALPVITTRSPGILDYVIEGETGILVSPGDQLGLRDALEYLLANPAEAQRLGRNARQRVEEELNMDAYVSRIAEVLQNCNERSTL